MLNILGILTLLIVLWFFLYYKKALLKTRYRIRFEQLKEDLHTVVKEDGVDANSWAVSFLDKSISYASSNLSSLNFHNALGLNFIYSRDKKISAFVSKLQAELNLPVNAPLRGIYYNFGNLMVKYVIKKHKIFRQIFMKVHNVKEYRNNRDRRKPHSQVLEKIRALRTFPETSASKEFMS